MITMVRNLSFGSLWRWFTGMRPDRGDVTKTRRGRFRGRSGRRYWLEQLEDRTVPTGAIAGALDVPGEVDVYTFHLDADARLYFDSVTNNASLNWSLAGPAGTLVSARPLSQSDAIDLTVNPVLNLAAGDYTLTVDALADVTGAYEFRLHDLAGAIPLTPGVAVSGDLSPANETDLYRFSAVAGESFYFDVQARTGAANARWRLVSPFNEIIFERAFNNDLVNSDAGPFTFTQPGTYTLLLEGRVSDTGGANSGTYAFTVHSVTPAAANPLTVGGVTTGTIGTPGEVDNFTFNLVGDARLYFDSQTANAALTWTLTGPQGTVVGARPFTASDSFEFINSPVLELAAGSYTLTVDGSADATGAYQFRLSDLAAATAVTPGTSFSGNLNPPSETDLFRFDATAGDRAFFDVVAASDAGNTIWRLISPLGVQVFRQNLTDVAALTLPSTGTYTLLVEGWHSNTGLDSYTLNAVIQTETAPTPLTLGSTVTGNLDVAGERDRYTFTLAANALAYFDALTNNASLNWTLAGPAGTLVSARAFTATDSFDFASNPALSLVAGDYTLTLAAQQSSTGAYSFRLANLLDPALTPITPGTPFSGELTLPNETDLYRFSAAAGDQFLFDVTAASDSSSNIVWQLIGPHGSVLFRRVGLTDVATLTVPGAGDYTLLIEGWIGNSGTDTYTINIVPQGNVPPGFTGTALTLGSTVSDTIAVSGEQDVYTFTLAAPARLYFDALSVTNMQWTLAGPPGIVVSPRNFNTSDSFDFTGNPAIELPAGDYGLTVSGVSGTTGAYSFRLSDFAAATAITPGTLGRRFHAAQRNGPLPFHGQRRRALLLRRRHRSRCRQHDLAARQPARRRARSPGQLCRH